MKGQEKKVTGKEGIYLFVALTGKKAILCLDAFLTCSLPDLLYHCSLVRLTGVLCLVSREEEENCDFRFILGSLKYYKYTPGFLF